MKLSELLEGIENATEIETKLNAALANKKCKLFIDDGDKNIYVPKSRLDSKIGELREANNTIEQLEGKISKLKNDYKDKDNETIADLEQQITDYKTKLKQITIDNAIKLVATESKAKDSKDLAKFLDMDKITMNENGEVAGLKEQVDELIKNKSYLFEASEPEQSKSPFPFMAPGDPGRPVGGQIGQSKTFHEGDFGKMLSQQNKGDSEKPIDSDYFFK